MLGEKVSATLIIHANVSDNVSGGGVVLEAYNAASSGDSGLWVVIMAFHTVEVNCQTFERLPLLQKSD